MTDFLLSMISPNLVSMVVAMVTTVLALIGLRSKSRGQRTREQRARVLATDLAVARKLASNSQERSSRRAELLAVDRAKLEARARAARK